MKPQVKQFTAAFGSQTIVFETGKLAGQAGGAVTAQVGDTMIFASATMGGVREGIDFFPLSVEYEERLYAGGRIPGSFFRREGRPGVARLVARLPNARCAHCLIRICAISRNAFDLIADRSPLDILAVNAFCSNEFQISWADRSAQSGLVGHNELIVPYQQTLNRP
jgi:polyribonucleotide nucleotidyltransferase